MWKSNFPDTFDYNFLLSARIEQKQNTDATKKSRSMKVTEICVIGFVSQFSPASLSANFGLLSEAAQPTIQNLGIAKLSLVIINAPLAGRMN